MLCPGKVHPRERGEHRHHCHHGSETLGSSPRARGTQGADVGRIDGGRFIPASAGNTRGARSRAAERSVHPRERGEHPSSKPTTTPSCGSSPRARGTPPCAGRASGCWRFIPASAGNTFDPSTAHHTKTVHPRERGEHSGGWFSRGSPFGSSPRARGTPRRTLDSAPRLRFIPASAGNTHQFISFNVFHAVHPRERGEHTDRSPLQPAPAGSSPRARGTHPPEPPKKTSSGFIPASAGNTWENPA